MKTSDALKLALQGVKKYVDNSINTNSIVRPYEIFRVEETVFGKTGYIDVETMEPSVKYGLSEAYLDCDSVAFVVPTTTTPYAIVCIAASFQVSDLMVTEKWEGDPSKGEEGLYIIARGLNEDYKINIRHKESKDGVTVEVIRNTRYLHVSNTKEFIPTGDYNPATKKYVDDAIDDNKFSGDYNDLENRPCYDNREHIELLFDNDLTGRETITSEDGNTIFVKLKGDIQPEMIDGISQGTYTVRYFDGEGGWHDETYQVSDFIYKVDDLSIHKIDDIIIVLDDCFVDTWWQSATSFTNGIWVKYMQEEDYYSTYVTSIEYMDSSSGEIKKLDEKFVSYKPGIKPEEGQSITIRNWHTEGSIEATVSEGAEIFNDYKNNFATGECSHAEGRYANAVGDCSHAEGSENTAEGFAAHAEGSTTSSSGEASHSEGFLTEASGNYSHAEGYWAEASGEISHAEGEWTKASSECQHVQGKYNIEDAENKYAHIVGNGNSRARSNAHTLDWNGNAWFQGKITLGENNIEVATKQDVSDAIEKNGFSGDYNDLSNKPIIPSVEGLASESYVNDAVTQLSDNLQGQINDLFQNVSNGKELIASAITDKGVDASKEETFQSLSEKINQIPVGPPGSNIIGYINEENDIYVSLTELESGTYTLKFEDYEGLLDDFDDIGTVEVE